MTTSNRIFKQGMVIRRAGSDLVYVRTSDTNAHFCIVNDLAEVKLPANRSGGLMVGDQVEFEYDAPSGVVRAARLLGAWNKGETKVAPNGVVSDASLTVSDKSDRTPDGLIDFSALGVSVEEDMQLLSAAVSEDQTPPQIELQPGVEAAGTIRIEGALPEKVRSFKKLVDASSLLPGDLMLARSHGASQDMVSSLITEVQEKGGYRREDARWTHAAMYVGDGGHVVEATFEGLSGGVRLTRLADYCDGSSILRFRRPNAVYSNGDRWKLCVRALARLKNDYNFGDCIQMWLAVKFLKQTLDLVMRRRSSSAVICSALYADAFSEAMGRTLGDRSGTCVPAWLSASSAFDDVETRWLTII